MSSDRASVLRVGAFTAFYLIAATIAAFGLGNREFLFYIVVMVILIAAVYWVHSRANSLPALCGPSAFGAWRT